MQKRRFNLPPLDLIQGFEAAARNLSFTKAADELFITQSAVSRQIRGAGGASGRRPVRAPASRAGADRAGPHRCSARRPSCWSACRRSRTGCAPTAPRAHLTVTTTSGFASLWLIPRLRGFTRCSPTSMCASPPPTSTSTWSAAWSTWRCATAEPDGRAGGRHTAVRRGAVSRLQPGAARRGAACPAHSAGPASTTRCCTWTGPRRLARLGHLAGGAGVRRPQARRLAAASTATSR